jgi:hypothetical protein
LISTEKGKHTKNSRATMVCVVDEDVVIGTAIDHLATATLNGTLVSQNCCKEIVDCHILPCVVLYQQTSARYLISNYISKTSMEKLPSSKKEIAKYASISGTKSATIALSCSVSSNSNTKGQQIFCESRRTQASYRNFL